MNRRKNIITTLSLVFMLFFPSLSFSMPESGETVTQRGTVNDDYYVAGGTVDINAVITGDVVIGGLLIFALLLSGLGAVILQLKDIYSQAGDV